jgi:hypothetical protein
VERRRRRRRVKGREAGGQGETPDWIRELFALARRGNLDKLVSHAHFSKNAAKFYAETHFVVFARVNKRILGIK